MAKRCILFHKWKENPNDYTKTCTVCGKRVAINHMHQWSYHMADCPRLGSNDCPCSIPYENAGMCPTTNWRTCDLCGVIEQR